MALIDNKKSRFNYDITETFEAGLELFGHEVKSVKGGHGSLQGAYILASPKGAVLVGALIPPYQAGNIPEGYNQRRHRRLLLTKKELKELTEAGGTKGLTIVPIKLYNKEGLIKLSLGIAKARKKHDKREHIKAREDDRHIERIMKGRRVES